MKKKILKLPIILIAIAIFIAVYICLFNGKGVYFTYGMKKDVALKTGTGLNSTKISEMATKFYFSKEKSKITTVSENKILSEKINGESLDTYVKNSTKGKISRIASLNNMATQKGVVLSSLEQQKVEKASLELYQALNENEKNELLATREKIEKMYEQLAIAYKMENELTKNLNIEVSLDEARVVGIQYIYSMSEEAIRDAKKSLDAGQPFSSVAAKVNGNNNYTVDVTRYDIDKKLEEVIYALHSGQVSNIVEADGKYYIIKCTSDNKQSKTDANKEKREAYLKNKAFEEKILPYENNLFFEINKSVFKKLNVEKFTEISADFDEIFRKNFN